MDSVDYFLLKEQEVLSCSLKKNNINIYKKNAKQRLKTVSFQNTEVFLRTDMEISYKKSKAI